MNGAIAGALREFLPAEALLPDSASASWPPGSVAPAAFVAPTSLTQTARLMERASREGWRVLPAGLCTWLAGSGASEVDLVVSTRKLRSLTAYEPADLTFTADAGIPWGVLHEATKTNGQWLPLDPPGYGQGSLGALVATGVSGPLRHAYGAPRDHVLGVTMVSGDGRILNWGGRVVKNVAGFDVTRLSTGSWGALGVITSVSARLFPIPERDLTILVGAPSAEDLLAAARGMALSPLPFSAVELLDPVEAVRPRLDSEALGAALALRITGSEAQVREMEARVVRELSGGTGGGEGPVLFLRDRESVGFHDALSRWEDGIPLVLRLSTLPSQMAALLKEVRDLAPLMGLSARESRVAAHVGVGVVRVGITPGPVEEDVLGALARGLIELRGRLEMAGGSLTLSHGPRALVKQVGAWGETGPEAALMKGLRDVFDPAGILLPERIVT